jgi:hypothetical protein
MNSDIYTLDLDLNKVLNEDGVSLLDKGNNFDTIIDHALSYGYDVNKLSLQATKSRVTTEATGSTNSGTLVALAYYSGIVLRDNNSFPHARELLHGITVFGCENIVDISEGTRIRSLRPYPNEDYFDSEGYLIRLADYVGIPPQKLTDLINTLRASATFEIEEDTTGNLLMAFNDMIDAYLYLMNGKAPSQIAEKDRLLIEWKANKIITPADWYNKLSELSQDRVSSRYRGKLLPYEMTFLRQVTERQFENPGLTSFDRFVFRHLVKGYSIQAIEEIVEDITGVRLSTGLSTYITVLHSDFPNRIIKE